MTNRPIILEFEAYRVVDFGTEVYFERRATDSLGNEKWDDCLKERGDRMELPAGLVFGLLGLAEGEGDESKADETEGQDSDTDQAASETPPAKTETIEGQMAEIQRRKLAMRKRTDQRRKGAA